MVSVLSTARFMKRIALHGTNSGSDLLPEPFDKYMPDPHLREARRGFRSGDGDRDQTIRELGHMRKLHHFQMGYRLAKILDRTDAVSRKMKRESRREREKERKWWLVSSGSLGVYHTGSKRAIPLSHPAKCVPKWLILFLLTVPKDTYTC